MRRSPQYAVAITAVHKWEERFMREWLEYHLLVGVGHFFLFPNKAIEACEEPLPKVLPNAYCLRMTSCTVP